MTERRTVRRYQVAIPIAVWGPDLKQLQGTTRDMSTNGVYLFVDEPVSVGAPLQFLLRLPTGSTNPEETLVRGHGKAMRVEEIWEEGARHVGIAAAIEAYSFIPKHSVVDSFSRLTAA